MNELVSVVIPCYNRRDTILNCINSILNQTYNNIEIIVVDDASTDKTYELFADNCNEKIHFFRYEINKGACYARNFGVKQAKGDYIAFQDSDDIWHPEKIKEQIDYLKKENAELVFCGMNRIDPINGKMFYYPTSNFQKNFNNIEQLLCNNMISTQTIVIKRKVSNKVLFDESFKRFQDWDFALQALIAGVKIVYLKKALVDSTIQKNSISANVRTGEALEHLFQKYAHQYNKYPHSAAIIYSKMGQSFKNTDRKKTIQYFKLSIKNKFNIKNLAKLILYIFHLWK